MAQPIVEASADRNVTAFRWVILLLVFAATAINYLDRQIIAILKPVLEDEFNWTDTDYGHVVSAFQFSAAVAYLFVGWFIDRVGLRWGYALSVGVWSVVAMLHAAGRTVTDFVVARMVLGVSEAGNTPAAVKAIANWFPVRERAFALGVMNSGSNSGAIIAPLIVPALALAFGWRAAFVITGGTGLIWLVAWLAIKRQPPAEIAAAAAPEPPKPVKVRWGPLLRDRRVWAIAGAKFLTDAVWWFLLFWLPDFLHRVYDLDLKTFGLPLATVYAMATVGALSAGALPAIMLNRGLSLNAARKISLLVAAILVLPLPLALNMHSAWSAVLVVGIGLAAHQGFSTNVFALATDLFPREFVATVVGIGALFGNIGGLIILEATGRVLDATGSYTPMFMYCAGAYLAALALVQVLVPRVQSPVGHT